MPAVADPNALADPNATAGNGTPSPAKLPQVAPIGGATPVPIPATPPTIAPPSAPPVSGAPPVAPPVSPSLPTVSPVAPVGGNTAPSAPPSNVAIAPPASAPPSAPALPKMFAGEDTSVPGSYAQNAAMDAFQGPSNINPSDAGMSAVTNAIGTAAQVFGNHDGSAGVVTTINGAPTRLTYNPANGTFSDGSTTYTADQVKQFTQAAGLGGVVQHIDTPVGGPAPSPTQADVSAAQPGAVLANGGTSPTALPSVAPLGPNSATATDQGFSPVAPKSGIALATPTMPAGNSTTDSGFTPANPSSLQAALTSAASGGIPASTNPSVGTGVSTTATDPNNPLTNQTLSVGALNDPVSMAINAWKTGQDASNPQYEADLRDALRSAAAGGGLGSGELNTETGNIANARQLASTTALKQLLTNALGTQNDNAYKNLNQANEQQNFQAGQQGTAFNQNLAATQEQSGLNSTAFAQALQQLTAGQANNPAGMQLTLSQIFGQNAAAATAALANLTKASATNSTTAGSTSALQNALQQYINSLNGKGNAPAGTSTAPPSAPSGGANNGVYPDGAGGYTDGDGNPVDSYGNPLAGVAP